MTIEVSCNIVCRVSQPLLDFFHWYSICQQKWCTRMAQIVKTYRFQVIFLYHIREMRWYIVRSYKLPKSIFAHIIGICFIVSVSEQSCVMILTFIFGNKNLFNMRYKRQSTTAGCILELILTDNNFTAVSVIVDHLVLNANGFIFKVYRITFQP